MISLIMSLIHAVEALIIIAFVIVTCTWVGLIIWGCSEGDNAGKYFPRLNCFLVKKGDKYLILTGEEDEVKFPDGCEVLASNIGLLSAFILKKDYEK